MRLQRLWIGRSLAGLLVVFVILWYLAGVRTVAAGKPPTASNSAGISHPLAKGLNGQTAGTLLLAADGRDKDGFGVSVGIDGDLMVVGASDASTGPDNAHAKTGAAYVFSRNQGGANHWGQVAKLVASDPETDAVFGGAVAISGDTIVVGSSGKSGGTDGQYTNAGAAYVFYRNQGGANHWGQVKKLTPPAGQMEDNGDFGIVVALSGDTILIGASRTIQPGQSRVYVFARNQGGADSWGQVTILTAPDLSLFTNSVALNGDIAAVGEVNENQVGHRGVYLFARNQGGANHWGELAQLVATDQQPGDRFGLAVDVDPDGAVVGSVAFTQTITGSVRLKGGAAYVFARNQGGANHWGQTAKLTIPTAANSFGSSVALKGNVIAVSDVFAEELLTSTPGTVHIYAHNLAGTNFWCPITQLTSLPPRPTDLFGFRLAIGSDQTIVVGIPAYVHQNAMTGAALVQSLSPLLVQPDRCSTFLPNVRR